MIVDLVEEAVEIKIHFENFTGMLQSDYEFCYAIGKMHKILNLALEKELTIEEQKEKIEEKMGNYEPKDYIEKNLIKLIREYRIQMQSGEELKQLLEMGYEKDR